MKNETSSDCISVFRSETPDLLKKILTEKWVQLISRAEKNQRHASGGTLS